MKLLQSVCVVCINCSANDFDQSVQRFDTKPEITVSPTGPTLTPVGGELPVEGMPSAPLHRSTSARMAPPSPLIRRSTSASTTVVADVHRDAAELPARTTSGPSLRPRDQHRPEVAASSTSGPSPRLRDQHRPEVAASRQLPQRQRFAAPEDRRCRALRHPVSEFSAAAAEYEQRQWTSLEHGVVDARRSASTERPTRRVHSYEDRYLLQRQKGTQSMMPPMVLSRSSTSYILKFFMNV